MSIESGTLTRTEVRSMFDRLARVYDPMNVVMTAGLDGRWRRLTAQAVVEPGSRVLDVCCGTGDLAIAALDELRLPLRELLKRRASSINADEV